MKVKIAGREVDVDRARPLTLRDLRAIREEFEIDLASRGQDERFSLDDVVHLAWYVLRKADPATTLDEALDLTADVAAEIITYVNQAEVERPT